MTSAHQRRKLLAALSSAQALAKEIIEATADDAAGLVERIQAEGRRADQARNAMVLALVADELTPVSLFRPWASRRTFRRWEIARQIILARKNGKVCVKPSDFFAMWRQLRDEGVARNSGGEK